MVPSVSNDSVGTIPVVEEAAGTAVPQRIGETPSAALGVPACEIHEDSKMDKTNMSSSLYLSAAVYNQSLPM